MSLSVTKVVSALICFDELYCAIDQSGVGVAGATNAVNTRQCQDRVRLIQSVYFFPRASPSLIPSLLPLTHLRVFVLSPVSLASRDQDGGPSNLGSHEKIGDCEQSENLFSFNPNQLFEVCFHICFGRIFSLFNFFYYMSYFYIFSWNAQLIPYLKGFYNSIRKGILKIIMMTCICAWSLQIFVLCLCIVNYWFTFQ